MENGSFEVTINVRDCGASGSEFETGAKTTAGSPVVVLDEIGDFQVGQQMAVSKCNPTISDLRVWQAGKRRTKPPKTEIQVRGYDGSLGN